MGIEIASLIGFLSGFFKSGIELFYKYQQDKKDKAHDLAILQVQLAMRQANLDEKLEEVKTNATVLDTRTLYSTFSIGVRWVDSLNALMRPIIAFAITAESVFTTFAAYKALMIGNAFWSPSIVADVLWSTEDSKIFMTIICFYFGGNAGRRVI